ncbi:MAG: hypothetical protein KF760_34995 [Candidatus Eremiobacteraeota bacterium]|nr:hypothetical protein [Candidatus Eremiobacteraeota bacterium]MCW5869628.1 hypothetical protein [Candidatus Eremiobacteraeota bacterium]
MDGIRPQKQSWLQSGPPKLKREPSPYSGAADYFREMARQKLEATVANPGPDLIEFTALQLVEHKYLEQGSGEVAPAPAAGQPKFGMLGNPAYMGALASSQLACMPALAPVLIDVLGDLDPQKIFGTANFNGENKWIIAGGSLADQIKVSQAVGAQGQVLGIPLTGVIDPGEQGRLAKALQPIWDQMGPERVKKILKNLHIQTLLGEMQNGSAAGMAGLGGNGQVAISRDALLDHEKAKDYLGHEIGHLVDEEMGAKFGLTRLSDAPGSPFGQGLEAGDFRSDYARRNRMEDFAEAHADLMLNWRQYKQFPELGLLARGKYGEKLTFIAQQCYDWYLAPARPHLQEMAEAVRSGQSPLGYRNADGELVDADRHLQRILRSLMEHTGTGGKLDEEQFFNVSKPEQSRRLWVLNALREESNQPAEAISVQTVTGDLARASSLEPGDPERARLGTGVLQALELGGPYFYDQCRRHLGDSPALQQQLSSMMIVAGPTWQAGTF